MRAGLLLASYWTPIAPEETTALSQYSGYKMAARPCGQTDNLEQIEIWPSGRGGKYQHRVLGMEGGPWVEISFIHRAEADSDHSEVILTRLCVKNLPSGVLQDVVGIDAVLFCV